MSPQPFIGHYKIISKLGEGGMGAVYRATDTKLNRDVAIKVLPEAFAQDAGRMRRFEREAQVLASLNHPNIAGIYGVEQGAIVMELVEGERPVGPLPVDTVIDYARQIATGLEAAHEKGVVHRDLKPANIKVTPDGVVKLLDFGLAKARDESDSPASGGNPTMSPTLSLSATQAGTILGTAAYMSPEQARGKTVDRRADIWAFGIILHELLTGRHPLGALETVSDTLAAVLLKEPDLSALGPDTPSHLRRLIERCLRKDPKQRLRDIGDARLGLDEPDAPQTAAAQPRGDPRWLPRAFAAALVLAGGLAAGALLMLLWAPTRGGIANYRYTPIEISHQAPADPTWSQDGQAFAYSALVEGKRQVFVRFLKSPASAQLTHGAHDFTPLGWSSDGKRIYIADVIGTLTNALYSLSVTGGEPEFVMPLRARVSLRHLEAQVSPDGKLLAADVSEGGTRSLVISSPVGSPFQRYQPAPFESENPIATAEFGISPDGSQILYFVNSGPNGGGEQAWMLPLPPGKQSPKRVLKDLPVQGGTPFFSWFPDSRHVVISFQEHEGDARHLWTIDMVSGRRKPLTTGLFDDTYTAVSPDGRQILFQTRVDDYRLLAASLEDASLRTVMESQRRVVMPQWAAKGDRFIYVSGVHEPEIWLHESDGSERAIVTPAMFPPGTSDFSSPSLSPSGDRVAYSRRTAVENLVWISSLAGGPPVRLTSGTGTGYETMGSWSPDGGRIAYLRGGDGRGLGVMIAKTSGQATAVKVEETSGAMTPEWSPTGEWIALPERPGDWKLVSPDGKESRSLGQMQTRHLAFARDGKTVYGIRNAGGHHVLFSMAVTGGPMKAIGEIPNEFAPQNYFGIGIRFSVAPDGKSLLYSTFSSKTSLWMLEGFEKP